VTPIKKTLENKLTNSFDSQEVIVRRCRNNCHAWSQFDSNFALTKKLFRQNYPSK
jgi:hypothetical protein